jgi:hypothetical protein
MGSRQTGQNERAFFSLRFKMRYFTLKGGEMFSQRGFRFLWDMTTERSGLNLGCFLKSTFESTAPERVTYAHLVSGFGFRVYV